MSFLTQWQMQQKALKDAERDRKKNASSFLHKYRGGEHDIKDQKQQKALKDAERDRKKNASTLLHSYKGSEHDIKDQKQQKALKDADREGKKNASSFLHNYRGSENDIKDQKQQKALKDAERESKKNASSLLHSYKGGEHDIKEYERAVIANRKKSKNTEHKISSNDSPETNNDITSSDSPETKNDIEDDGPNTGDILSSDLGETKNDTADKPAGTSRRSLTIEFSFGIIYPDHEPAPEADDCAMAARVIVPHVISQWTNETKIFCNPKTPEVFDDIVTDDWYDGDDSIRYKVKGDVVVQIFAESSAEEVAEGLRKVLRRHVSFRPVSAGEIEKSRMQNVIGEGEHKWMRVREGRLDGLGITF